MPTTSTSHKLIAETPATVLVVDDESCVRQLLTRWLIADGRACAQAADAQSAWEYLQGHEVHLVTLDIRMAGGSGLELLHQINKAYPDTSVIMVSGLEETQTAIEALTYGASAYLVKPVKRDQLVFHARRAMERRQLVLDDRQYMRRVREQTVAVRRAHEETIYRLLSACLWRHAETGAHFRRVGLLSELLARAAGWPEADTDNIRMAAAIHDIGNLGIPEAIVRKPAKLFLEEFETMKLHTLIGARMLAGSDVPMLQMAHEIALNHHEHWDGEGYPARLAGYAIPESARIVAIVDAYDALTHDRDCRRALPEDEALTTLQREAGRHFDPLLLAIFFSHLEEIRRVVQENPDEPSEQAFPRELLGQVPSCEASRGGKS